MRIALITNKSLRHKYWTYELFVNFDVGLVIHPANMSSNILSTLNNKIFKYGFFYGILKIISISFGGVNRSIKSAENKMLYKYAEKYESIPNELVVDNCNINSEEIIKLIVKNRIDVICFLGGGIANSALINSPKVACLNFHSGLSPYYNGNKTIFHALSDFRPNFCGGTLMKMNEKIDGGDILMHYLTPINDISTPGEVFISGIIGSVKLYKIYLKKMQDNMPKGVSQSGSFQYLRNIDWNIVNDIRIKYFFSKGVPSKYFRKGAVIDYSDLCITNTKDLHAYILSKIM